MFKFCKFSLKPEISQLSSSGILLYTKQTQQSYGQYCLGFRGGTRNETQQQQGSLLSLFLLYDLQSLNEQFLLNSQQIVNFLYDTESHIWNSVFLDDDTGSAAEFLCNIAFRRMDMQNSLSQLMGQFNQSQQKDRIPIESVVQKSCFPFFLKQLAFPQAVDFNQFQEANFTPDNCIIGYSGRRSHKEISEIFESLIQNQNECISFLIKVCNRKFQSIHNKSDFIPQTIRIEDEFSSDFEVALIFDGASLFDTEQLAIEMIISEVLGNIGIKIIEIAPENNIGEIGIKVRSRCYNELLQHHHFLYNAGAIIQNYSDCGRFGICVQGNALQKQDIYQLALTELKKLRKISDYEIERAKNIVITKYYVKFERQQHQLIEEITLGGKLFIKEEYPKIVQQITRMQIEQRVQKLLKSQLCLIYMGKGVKTMPDENMTMLRLSYD